MTEPSPAINTLALEGDLRSLGDDEYFDALEQLPPVRDVDGRLVDVAGDVQDRRNDKAAAVERGEEFQL